jgi:D-erythro-7,8-dihydroneopterin triphosphate epimerase
MDKIHIRDLAAECIIGTEPKERTDKQTVVFNLALECSLSKAGRSDRIDHTVNYKLVRDRIVRMVEASEYELIESLAEKVAELCLEDRRILRFSVTVDKPGALTRARSVAVEVQRSQPASRRKP